eukprot:CAMPEP_0172674748 /NCGR_PEP_ID=MMETSP1074-20121228/12902_1 /TAXON_ID=2916 /ORGANISM="Ceratium fusus, Strain PA161109" /LENGTH=333 /DNA_ID=CAMNT_0013492179 /DNA_START=113 /DNA_END=1111 /DNA_ORIENTATION=-
MIRTCLMLATASLWLGDAARDSENVDMAGAALENDEAGLQKSDCKGNLWRPYGTWKKAGAWGEVFDVRKVRETNCKSSTSGSYVLKRGLQNDADTLKIFKTEANAMQAAKDNGCVGIVEIEDTAPCLEKEGTNKANTCSATRKSDLLQWMAVKPIGFVMQKKDGGTLKDWLQFDHRGRPLQPNLATCGMALLDKVKKALDCLHGAQYIHGDVKPDNIFLSKVPNNPKTKAARCPAQLWLADLGLSSKIDNLVTQWNCYACSTHLPAGMFRDAPKNSDTLAISDGQGNFVASAAIDLCSFKLLAERMGASADSFEGLPVNCGSMGPRGTCNCRE